MFPGSSVPLKRSNVANGLSTDLERLPHSRLSVVASFFIGATAFVFVNVGGRLSVGEILCIPIGLAALISMSMRPTRYAGWLVAATTLMAAGLILSGSVNDNSLSETQAGLANYGVLSLSAVAIASLLIYTRGRALTPLIMGAAFGQVIGFYFSPTSSALIDPWKFAIGWSVNVLVLVVAWRVNKKYDRRLPGVAIGLVLAAFNVAQGSRSAGVVIALCTVAFLFVGRSRSRNHRSFVAVLAVLAVALLVATSLYESATENGYFGAAAAQKLADQSGNYGLIFGARKELLFLVFAFISSPLIGWGTVARVPPEERFKAYDLLANGGYFLSSSDVERLMLVDRLPLHSVALGALVQAGMFALPLVLLLVGLCFFAVRGVVTQDLGFAPLFVVLSGAMHLFASPLGDSTRIQLALALALGMYVVFVQKGSAERLPIRQNEEPKSARRRFA